jgi:hypothetical protein
MFKNTRMSNEHFPVNMGHLMKTLIILDLCLKTKNYESPLLWTQTILLFAIVVHNTQAFLPFKENDWEHRA